MDRDYKRMTNFLVEMGIEAVPHTQKTYLGHLIAVHRLLETQGFSQDCCRAGMFHSIYGTERFQGFKLPVERRGEVQALIGERAERLAYANCAMDRATFDAVIEQPAGPYRFRDRITGETFEFSQADCDELCRVHLYDWLEQAPRQSEWDYRRKAYRRMAERLGKQAVEDFDRVYAQGAVSV